jgi:hypothetical protein
MASTQKYSFSNVTATTTTVAPWTQYQFIGSSPITTQILTANLSTGDFFIVNNLKSTSPELGSVTITISGGVFVDSESVSVSSITVHPTASFQISCEDKINGLYSYAPL